MLVTYMLVGSVLCLAVWVAAYDGVGGPKRRLAMSAALAGLAAAVYWNRPGADLEVKGTDREAFAIGICYAAMLVGMVAQYFYRQAERGARRFVVKPVELMMPVFASPIVFIPLLTIVTEATVGGLLSKAHLMVYLVAFQNGFFWKSFIDEIARRQSAPVAASDSGTRSHASRFEPNLEVRPRTTPNRT